VNPVCSELVRSKPASRRSLIDARSGATNGSPAWCSAAMNVSPRSAASRLTRSSLAAAAIPPMMPPAPTPPSTAPPTAAPIDGATAAAPTAMSGRSFTSVGRFDNASPMPPPLSAGARLLRIRSNWPSIARSALSLPSTALSPVLANSRPRTFRCATVASICRSRLPSSRL
jgi:hypothetical protein